VCYHFRKTMASTTVTATADGEKYDILEVIGKSVPHRSFGLIFLFSPWIVLCMLIFEMI
jgi:hypothetical protein